jgi:hypothetical protein
MTQHARHLNWVIILACWSVYALAFAFPAVAKDKYPRLTYDPAYVFPDPASDRLPSFERAVVRDYSGLSGRDAFAVTWEARDEVWLANLALWVGTIFLAWRLWSCAAVVSFLGLGLALFLVKNAVGDDTAVVYGTGYWLWVSSLGVLLAGSLAGWRGVVPRDERRSAAEVFRGWRGVALGSWLLTAVVVFVVWWDNYKYLRPPFFWRAVVISAWSVLGVLALAVERSRNDRHLVRPWQFLTALNLVVFALLALAMWWFWDDISPPLPPR